MQPIAIAYLAAFLLVRRSARFQAATAAAIWIGYALLLAVSPGAGYEQGANLVATVDLAVLGRTHHAGWGTVLSTLPTVATTIQGMLLGRLLMSRRPERQKLAVLAAVGVGGVALGVALDPVIPIVMKLWTTSYGLASAGFACLEFLAFYWIVDVRGYTRWTFPLVVIGMNAVAIYMLPTFCPLQKIVGLFTEPLAAALGRPGPLFQAVVFLSVEWLILYWMYRRKIFLTA